MEKRLFLAVGLSLLVVVVFQSFFAPKNLAVSPTQTINQDKAAMPADSIETQASQPLKVEGQAIGFKEQMFSVKAGKFNFDISNNGGSIKKIHLIDYKYDFPVKAIADVTNFYGKPFVYNKLSNNSFTLTSIDSNWSIQKTISVEKYKINIQYEITNLNSSAKELNINIKPFDIDLSRLDDTVLNSDWTLFEYATKINNKIERKEQVSKFSEKWNKVESKTFQLIAFRDRYFVTIVEPKAPLTGYTTTFVNLKELDFNVPRFPVLIDSSKIFEYSFTVFCGPQKLDILKEAKDGYENVLVFSSWGWLDFIAKGIYWMLGAIHKILPIWGLCIILVSLIVYGAMYPLTLKSMMSMKKMQALQPKMAQLKEKYKDSPEKLNKEVVELYKVNNVNPVSGCLPMLLQMPIFVGLYQVLWRSVYFRDESFLWIKDLSMPDRLFKLPFNLPFLGEYFNILPIMMIFIMLAQQTITLKSMAGGDPDQVKQQKIMAVFFPIFLGFIFYNFASGLNLYFVVFYSLSALSQWHIAKKT